VDRGIRYLAVSVLWLVPVLFFTEAFLGDWPTFWNSVLVPTWTGPFLDLGSISSAVEVQRRGGDPLIANPLDAFHRPMNYPRIWLFLFSELRITRAAIPEVGISFCVLYLISISWLMVRATHWPEMCVMLIAGLSLAPWLAIERGNTDVLVFALIFFGFVSGNKYLQTGTYFLAAMLKIFPVVGLMIDAVRRPAKERALPLAFLALATALLAWQWKDLVAIRRNTPVSTYLSYGFLSLKAQLGYVSARLLVASCAAALLIALAVWISRPHFEDSLLRSRSGEMFLLFGGIYAFTFAMGSNWNYRLIFLLPTLPFAMELVRSARRPKWAIIYITMVLAAENSFALGTYAGIPLGDVATFTLFAMIGVVFVGVLKGFLEELGARLFPPARAEAATPRAVS